MNRTAIMQEQHIKMPLPEKKCHFLNQAQQNHSEELNRK